MIKLYINYIFQTKIGTVGFPLEKLFKIKLFKVFTSKLVPLSKQTVPLNGLAI